jgi:tetrahydromethanopterin:alpha-L-glutamate ligase
MAKRIAIFAEHLGWHVKQLMRPLVAGGAESVCVPLKACRFDVDQAPSRIRLPGFGNLLPDGAIVRSISAGSFEQVTLRLGMLHALRELGVPVCNDARAIERCVDKSTTTFLLWQAGIPTPPTWVCESPEQAQSIARREIGAGKPLVIKPLFGAQGRGLLFVDDLARMPDPDLIAGVYYLQHYVERGEGVFRDWRVLVVGGRAVAAMIRHGVGWITNVGQGARCEGTAVQGELGAIAEAAAKAVGADLAGVDIIRDVNSAPFVLEVNSMPSWQGLQSVSSLDLGQQIADYFLARLTAADKRGTVVPLAETG